jgi:hypothetical protein
MWIILAFFVTPDTSFHLIRFVVSKTKYNEQNINLLLLFSFSGHLDTMI